MNIASRFTIVRSPPQNGRRSGSGSGQERRKDLTEVIFKNPESRIQNPEVVEPAGSTLLNSIF
jgi:hypothetical protein